MKKSILFVSAFSFAAFFSSCSDSHKVAASDVPQAVTSAFNAKYPDATGTEWKTEKSDGKEVYEAAFKSGGKEIEAEFFDNGTFKQED